MNSQELEDRLVLYGVSIIQMTEAMPRTPAGKHLSEQLLRSGTSPALNYAEARSAESHRDFTHKIKICAKELRESSVNLRIVQGAALHPQPEIIRTVLEETNELVAIFTASVRTAEQRSPRR